MQFEKIRISSVMRLAFENSVRKNPESEIVEKIVDSLVRGSGSMHMRTINLNISKKTAIACKLI